MCASRGYDVDGGVLGRWQSNDGGSKLSRSAHPVRYEGGEYQL